MHLNGILFTHAHYDHTAGVDELRAFTFRQKSSLPCLMSHETYSDLHRRFFYIFGEESKKNLYAAEILPVLLKENTGKIEFEGLSIEYASYFQMGMKITGFRLGDFAYVTDIRDYDETIWPFLKGVKTLIVSALRFTASPVHLTVDEAVEFSRRCGAENTWLTHISHELEHEHVNAYLPNNVRMAYDGLVLEDIYL
jgi:phosphoribosyl 1,2-cyclic phosphate phosphodiesterase